MSQVPREEIRKVVFDSILDGVFAVDKNWRIICFNRAAEQITGVSREQALGRHCSEVLRASVCGKDCALERTMTTEQPVVCKGCSIVNTSGERVPISVSTALLKDADGAIVGGIETFRDLSEIERLRKELERTHTVGDILARSETMRQVLDTVPLIAESSSSVLIEGESGTGKELLSRAIHNLSPRRDKPFVAVNCGALPDTLLESELFGYKAGAFTDAKQDKPGRFALAEGGTILLDEIGDVSSAMQAKLLRVLQERVYEPLGSVSSVTMNVRVITATNRNLKDLVDQGVFRQDLYYRVNVMRIELPPLRERRSDIPLLIQHFIAKFNALQGKSITDVSPEVRMTLLEYGYPGNVRELENIIEHAFVLCPGADIQLHHLPPELRKHSQVPASLRTGELTLSEMEGIAIADALRRHGGNRDAAAQALGIHRATLFRKIKTLGIHVPDAVSASERPSS